MVSIHSGSELFKLTENAQTQFMKIQRGDKDTRFCTFKLIDESTVDVDTLPTSTSGEDKVEWDNFVSFFPYNGCRYGLAVFPYTAQSDGVRREKVVFVQWAPLDSCKVRDRMLCSMFARGMEKKYEAMGGALSGKLEAADVSDLDFDDVTARIRVRTTVK